jgi:hypothetical protein
MAGQSEHEPRSRGTTLERLPLYVTLVGIFVYGFSRLALSAFYVPLGTTPEEVGLNYATTLASITGLLVILIGVVAALSILLAMLIPILRLFILPVLVLILLLGLASGAVGFGAIGLWYILEYALPLIAALTCMSVASAGLYPSLPIPEIPTPRMVLSALGIMISPLLLLHLRPLLYFVVLLCGVVWVSQQYLGGVTATLAEGDRLLARLGELLKYMMGEGQSKKEVVSAWE